LELGSNPIDGVTSVATADPSSPLEATPPGAGWTRAVRDGVEDAEGVGIRLCSDEFFELSVREPALPEFDVVSPPDEVPDEDEPALDVVVPAFRGTACAAAATGTASPSAIANVVSARVDLAMLVMTVAPWGLRDQPHFFHWYFVASLRPATTRSKSKQSQ